MSRRSVAGAPSFLERARADPIMIDKDAAHAGTSAVPLAPQHVLDQQANAALTFRRASACA